MKEDLEIIVTKEKSFQKHKDGSLWELLWWWAIALPQNQAQIAWHDYKIVSNSFLFFYITTLATSVMTY
jgi:hypothetical protein